MRKVKKVTFWVLNPTFSKFMSLILLFGKVKKPPISQTVIGRSQICEIKVELAISDMATQPTPKQHELEVIEINTK